MSETRNSKDRGKDEHAIQIQSRRHLSNASTASYASRRHPSNVSTSSTASNAAKLPPILINRSQSMVSLESTESMKSVVYMDGGGVKAKTEEKKMSVSMNVIEEDVPLEEKPIQWINIIFLPFQNWWRMIIIFTVCLKCWFGPMTAIFPFMVCNASIESHPILKYVKFFYTYAGDPLYIIDTFLYIVHSKLRICLRQVEEEAMKREYLPKPAFFLMLDFLALIPMFRLNSEDVCGPVSFWPNVLSFNEILIIYRIGHHYSLRITHSFSNLFVGYTLLFVLIMNALICMFLVLTKAGLCEHCEGSYDWRENSFYTLKIQTNFTLYLTAGIFMLSLTTLQMTNNTRPNTYLEFILVICLISISYYTLIYVIYPKIFSECQFHFLRYTQFHLRVKRILREAKRRHTTKRPYEIISKYYTYMWKKQNGITSMPNVINQLPRTLQIDIKQDLVWPVFHHSPCFRRTSNAFKRFLVDHVQLKYKIPGEKFFLGQKDLTHLYYIKSGIVQLHSGDDFTVSLLSVTGGTLFGDVSFFLPPQDKKIFARCLTYCEVFTLSRKAIIQALFMFPQDRRMILKSVAERINHAKILFQAKLRLRGLDRCEDEDFAWIKRRWWQIYFSLKDFELKAKRKRVTCTISAEEEEFHCSKYIGQLVLCEDIDLQRKSIFVRVKFPWILDEDSDFNRYWYKFVKIIVYIVLIVYTPVITFLKQPDWFKYFVFFVDIVYIFDVLITMVTTTEDLKFRHSNISTALIQHFQNIYFVMDLLALPFWPYFIVSGLGQNYTLLQHVIYFNRLIKVYMLFVDRYKRDIKETNLRFVNKQLFTIKFVVMYIPPYILYCMCRDIDQLSKDYHFDNACIPKDYGDTNFKCNDTIHGHFGITTIVLAYLTDWTFILNDNDTDNDYAVSIYDYILNIMESLFFVVLGWFLKMQYMSALYLKYQDRSYYQYLATNIKKYYEHLRIQPDLLVRLNRYLRVHWKYGQGNYVIYPDFIREEPYNIFWEVHGKIAEKVIGSSKGFVNANRDMVRKLAEESKSLIVPEHTIIYAHGVQVETVIWVVQGHVKCEYIDDRDEIKNVILDNGIMLAHNAVFFGQTCMRTFVAVSDAEIIYLKLQDFVAILQQYPNEWSYFETAIRELEPAFDALYFNVRKRNTNYQKVLRDRLAITTKQMDASDDYEKDTSEENNFIMKIVKTFQHYRRDPESPLILKWVAIRAVLIFIQMTTTSLQGGSGAVISGPLEVIRAMTHWTSIIDMTLKMFLPYYDKRGIIITCKRKTAVHYLSRCFVADIVCFILNFNTIVESLLKEEGRRIVQYTRLFGLLCDLYMIKGYFDYQAQIPSMKSVFLQIANYQVILFLVMIQISYFYVWDCINMNYDENYNLVGMKKIEDTCWLPPYLTLDPEPTYKQLHVVFADALGLIQGAFYGVYLGLHYFKEMKIAHCLLWIILNAVYWFQSCYCTALLILMYQGDTMIEHGIGQLKEFLQGERVNKDIIQQSVNHFTYWHLRSTGVDTSLVLNNHFSSVFKQDLNYYFYKTTLRALDDILKCGEAMNRQLAGACHFKYFLPQEQIIRENHLAYNLFIVHRGKCEVFKDGRSYGYLTKGSIFGQLIGHMLRPVKITVQATDHCDVLQIPFQDFHDFIDDDVQKNIQLNPYSVRDFMPVKKKIHEHPFTTIDYILRSKKVIKLPYVKKIIKAEQNKLYSFWLLWCWAVSPVLVGGLVFTMLNLKNNTYYPVLYFTWVLDFLHITNILIECCEMKYRIVHDMLQYHRIGWWKLADWFLYLDIASLIIPFLNYSIRVYQLSRLLRLHSVYKYYRIFFKGFKSRTQIKLLKIVLVLLLIHALTCGWMAVSCTGRHTLPAKYMRNTTNFNKFIDFHEWALPSEREGGCLRTSFVRTGSKSYDNFGIFLAPRDWEADYLVALFFISIVQTRINLEMVEPLTLGSLYFKNMSFYLFHLLELWLVTMGISMMYTKFRQMYSYDHRVDNLTEYLKWNGITKTLIRSVRVYTLLLWSKHKGSQLPEITLSAHQCLQEDILSALYLYHLQTPRLFQNLPLYFLKQLAVRLKRIVIFPGKYIVQEGEIYSCIYFIHEGEVEKWYTDINGESQMATLLSTNGYFGLLSGLFPNIPFSYSYKSRTIVDLVTLNYKDWQDLLSGYPALKKQLYKMAKNLRDEKRADKRSQSRQRTFSQMSG